MCTLVQHQACPCSTVDSAEDPAGWVALEWAGGTENEE